MKRFIWFLPFLALLPAAIINIPEDYSTIQEGINASIDGDTVLVQPGVYYGGINYFGKQIVVGSLYVNDRLQQYVEDTFINGSGNEPVVTFENEENVGTILIGFTIINGSSEEGGGIRCISSDPTIRNCIVVNNYGSLGGGVHCNDSNPFFYNTVISNNESDCGLTSTCGGGGLFCWQSNPHFINCTINHNSTTGSQGYSGHAIWIGEGVVYLINSIVWEYSWGQLIDGWLGEIDTTFSWIQDYTPNAIDPLFVDPEENILALMETSPCIDAGHPDLDGDGITWETDPDDQDPDGTRMDIGAFYFNQSIPGCTDSLAVNFDSDATEDDGSCIYLADIDPHFTPVWSGIPVDPMGIYIYSALLDNVDLRVGDEIAVFDGDLCVGAVQLQEEISGQLSVFCSTDDPDTPDPDGFTIGSEIRYRFWDASAQLEVINVVSSVSGGSDVFEPLGFSMTDLAVETLFGCTNPLAVNYLPEATVDDGSCVDPVLGCTDPDACNFDSDANVEDGSCLYDDCSGECGGSAFIDECGICCGGSTGVECSYWIDESNYGGGYQCDGSCGDECWIDDCGYCYCPWFALEENWAMDCNMVCDGTAFENECGCVEGNTGLAEFWCYGCPDPWALNYDPEAWVDDGTCQYPCMGDLDMSGSLDVVDVVLLVDIALDGDYVSYADFNDDTFVNIIDIVIFVEIILNPELLGCTDPLAENYNPEAVYDDGCEYACIDIDGNVYETVIIGNQEWMAENLRVTHYRNGETIPNVQDGEEWMLITTGAYCHYDNDPENTEIYGMLYNGFIVNETQNIAPVGWHIPSNEEWMQLVNNLGGQLSSGGDMKTRGTIESGDGLWYAPNEGATNASHFSAVPSGYRGGAVPVFNNKGLYTYFWTTTEDTQTQQYMWQLHYHIPSILNSGYHKRAGISIRCIRNETP